MKPLRITETRITARLWADHVTLTGDGTINEVQATYDDLAYPFVWIARADVVRDWPSEGKS